MRLYWFRIVVVTALFGSTLVSGDEPAKAKKPTPTKVAVLVFPGVELLDFAGPCEIFAAARDAVGNRLFDVYTVGPKKEAVDSLAFLSINPKYDPSDAPTPEILVIPGGNVNSILEEKAVMEWVAKLGKGETLMYSVCNGASVLGKLGLLDGLKVTTHHGNVEILGLLAPKSICLRDRRFIDNGRVVTAAGVSAGIDGALYLVAKLKGIETAHRSATMAEFDSWPGFVSKEKALPPPDREGVVSQLGRVHKSDRSWTVMTLLQIIRDKGVDTAVKLYPQMLKGAKGHDREMIEEAGLDEIGWWLLTNSRDREIGLSVLRFVVGVYPQSSKAHQRLGEGYLDAKDKVKARPTLEQALKLDPKNESAKAALKRCE